MELRWRPHSYRPPVSLLPAIEAHWRSARRQAQAMGARLFNGALCRLDGWQFDSGSLRLTLSRTDYRLTIASHGPRPVPWPPGEPRADGLGVNAAIETRDHQIVIVRRGARVWDSAGMLDTGGGHVDPFAHQRDGVPDPFVAIETEIEEEFGVDRGSIRRTQLLGLARHLPGEKPELLFRVQIALPLEALFLRIREARDREETDRLWGIPADPDAVLRFLERHAVELTSSGQAALAFYGRWRSGGGSGPLSGAEKS